MRSDSALTLSSRSARSSARFSTSTAVTIEAAKYRTFSSSRGAMSSRYPMRLGTPLKNQMCETGAARSMWPMRSRRTLPRYLDAAALADDALVADALVLAAVALPVARRPEDALAEEAVALRLQRAVVDRLRLRDLTRRPVADLLAGGKPDPNRVEVVDVDQVSPVLT